MTITVWRYETASSHRFGAPATYLFERPNTSGEGMAWADEYECTLPEGYQTAISADGSTQLYDEAGQRVEIYDSKDGHPAIIVNDDTAPSGYRKVTLLATKSPDESL